MASQRRPVAFVQLDIAEFIIETEEVVFSPPEVAHLWLKNLRMSLAKRDPSISEYGAKLLSEAEGFRESERERRADSRKKAAEESKQYQQPTNQLEQINGSQPEQNTGIGKSDRKPYPLHRREISEDPGPQTEPGKNTEDRQETRDPVAGSSSVVAPVTEALPSKAQSDLEQVHERRQASGKKLQVFGKTAMEMEYPDAYKVWQAAPAMARSRSSTIEFMKAWREQTKNGGIPPVSEVLASLEKWKRSKKWAENGGEYIEALHRWVNRRQWENPPASAMDLANEQYQEIDKMFGG